METKKTLGKNLTSIDEHLDKRYGPIGSKKRTNFEIKANAFANREITEVEKSR